MSDEAAPVESAGIPGEEPTRVPPSGDAPDMGAESREQPGSFGDSAAEMANETEVEAPPTPTEQSQQPEGGEPDADTEVDELGAMKETLVALTNDLQRLSAEYANYRKRVDRDRQLVAENAAFKALSPVVEVLDAVDRAREAGELEGGFKAVAEALERAVASSGLTRFAEPGDPFDPTRHDALSHLGVDPEVEVTTVKVVAKAGYAMGGRVIRAAQVLVVDPQD